MGASDFVSAFVAARWSEVCAAHPGVALSEAAFAERVAVCLDGADDSAGLEKLAAADVFLAAACEHGDARALSSFDADVLSQMPAFLAGVSGGEDLVDEVRQRVRERLLVARSGARPKIAEYAGRGPLGAWVRVVAVRVALDLLRQAAPRGGIEDAVALDPELSLIRDRYRDAFRDAIREAFAELGSDERSLLKLHFLEGLNLERLAVVFQVSRATAGRRVLALRERLAERTRDLLADRLGATPEEIASLVAILHSRVAWSLRSALGA